MIYSPNAPHPHSGLSISERLRLDDEELAGQRMSFVVLAWVAILVAVGLRLVFALQATQPRPECVRWGFPGEAPMPGTCAEIAPFVSDPPMWRAVPASPARRLDGPVAR